MSIFNAIASAAGASGYTFEMGEYTNPSQASSMTIQYANAHPERPAIIVLNDAYYFDNSMANAAGNVAWMFVDWSKFVGPTGMTAAYGAEFISFKYSTSGTTNLYKKNITSEEALDTRATRTEFYPRGNGASDYFLPGHTFKWIAIWL